jgi:hypothetical protein
MAQATFQIATYNYYFWSSRERGKTNLNLLGTGGETCAVWFVEDPNEALPDAVEQAPNYYSFYYHLHQLPSLVDLLRNESPVYVFFNNDSGFPNSRISSTDEPVGEGEAH